MTIEEKLERALSALREIEALDNYQGFSLFPARDIARAAIASLEEALK